MACEKKNLLGQALQLLKDAGVVATASDGGQADDVCSGSLLILLLCMEPRVLEWQVPIGRGLLNALDGMGVR